MLEKPRGNMWALAAYTFQAFKHAAALHINELVELGFRSCLAASKDVASSTLTKSSALDRPGSWSCASSRPAFYWPARPGPRSRSAPCRGGGAAHEELGEVQGAGRSHRDVPVWADAAVREAGQQSPRPPFESSPGRSGPAGPPPSSRARECPRSP